MAPLLNVCLMDVVIGLLLNKTCHLLVFGGTGPPQGPGPTRLGHLQPAGESADRPAASWLATARRGGVAAAERGRAAVLGGLGE